MTRPKRREALLEAACTVVADGGVGACSFEAIADAAGVAKTLPYAYFESVDEVLLSLFDHVIGELDTEIEQVVATQASFEELLRRSLDVWFDAVRTRGALIAALLDGRAHLGLADRIRQRDKRSNKLWHDVVAAHLGLGDPDAHLLAVMLNTSATGVIQLWVARRGSRADLLDAYVAMVAGAAAALQSR
jgi:AcrR family transcriptional regulator